MEYPSPSLEARSALKPPPLGPVTYPRVCSPEESRVETSNYLDGCCIAFEEQALREVIDYRGAHGVRLVSGGVLDYFGVWAGHVGIGDATGGAISHLGENVDAAKNVGKHSLDVMFDKL